MARSLLFAISVAWIIGEKDIIKNRKEMNNKAIVNVEENKEVDSMVVQVGSLPWRSQR